jgi:hypothetical protein
MVALVSVLVIVLISLLVTRVATVILVSTGMSHEAARFQAWSALSGAGFTTSESEAVVGHPFRRRVIAMLMLLGSAGLVGGVGSLALSFSGASGGQRLERVVVLAVGLAVLLLIARSQWVDRRLTALIGYVLRTRGIAARDYVTLLDLDGQHTVVELEVQPGDWLADRTLAEARLRDEGVIVLGIRRDGDFIGTPRGNQLMRAGDTLVLYGAAARLRELDDREAPRFSAPGRSETGRSAARARRPSSRAAPGTRR